MTAEMMRTDMDPMAWLRVTLLDLARREDECAADEAAARSYWQALPPSVLGHRAAAVALRHEADLLLAADRARLRQPGTGER
jgi:hypothetical protein